MHRIDGNVTVLHPVLNLPPDDDLPHWREEATCRADDAAEVFFPGGDRGQTKAMTDAAKLVCRACPVRIDCLWYAIETRQEYGVWGGATEPERRRLARKVKSVRSTSAVLEILAAS